MKMDKSKLNRLLDEISNLPDEDVVDYPHDYAYRLADWLYENLPRQIFNILAGDLEPQLED